MLFLSCPAGTGGDDGDDRMEEGEEKDYEYSSTRTSCLFRTRILFCLGGRLRCPGEVLEYKYWALCSGYKCFPNNSVLIIIARVLWGDTVLLEGQVGKEFR